MCIRKTLAIVTACLACLCADAKSLDKPPKTRNLIASVLIAEAGIDGAKAMTAVAEVIRNRANRDSISHRQVVLTPFWFSSMNNKTAWSMVNQYKNDKRLPTALKIADRLLTGRLGNSVNGATHFDCSTPFWAEGRRAVAVVGKHKFWRL